MLSRWTLNNFKSYSSEENIALAPLTLLCGANSSGKSSILQSMLLIKQTLEHSPSERVIALNGPLVQLGVFSDIINNQSAKSNVKEIGLGWKIDHRSSENKVNSMFMGDFNVTSSCLDFSFDTSGLLSDRATLELQPDLKSTRMAATLENADGETHNVDIEIERVTGRGRRIQYNSSMLGDDATLRYRIKKIDAETREAAGLAFASCDVVGANVSHFSPNDLIVRYDRNQRLSKLAAKAIIGHSEVRRFRMPPIKISEGIEEVIKKSISAMKAIPRYGDLIDRLISLKMSGMTIDSFSKELRQIPPSYRRGITLALSEHEVEFEKLIYEDLGKDITVRFAKVERIAKVSNASDYYFRFFLRYLGPLRADPRPLYPLQALGSPTDVGPKGEQTAAVLHLNGKRKVSFIASKNFKDNPTDSVMEDVTLSTAVADWLAYLGVAEAFETIEKGKLGHELRVRTPGASDFQDLTNVGVGVSQVLPIVVTCLLAPPGSTIILEQPELHLHPAVQARLADFFTALILSNKQCIIETHSEHLIERIRFRIAQDWGNKIQEKTKIFFFEKDKGSTSVREISVNRFGSIDDWPKDFFDQSQIANEEIVMMALRRHKAERSNLKDGSHEAQ